MYVRGHVRKRGSRWYIIYDVASSSGKRTQKWESGFSNKREAEAALATRIAEVQKNRAQRR